MVQWGSEILSFEIGKHLKSGLFEGKISNGWALAMAMALAIVPTMQKPNHLITKLLADWFARKNLR